MAAGGGGAWKVAYADFVTAMMAFFLVMWITAQSNAVKQAIARYFSHPYDATSRSAIPSKSSSGSSLIPLRREMDASLPRGSAKGKVPRGGGMLADDQRPDSDAVPKSGGLKRRSGVMLREGDPSGIGTIVEFVGNSTELDERAKQSLNEALPAFAGKRNKIEIRGHTNLTSVSASKPSDSTAPQAWQQSYSRCLAVMTYLQQNGIEPKRIRLSQAGGDEPPPEHDAAWNAGTARVDTYMLPEYVDEYLGQNMAVQTPAEQARKQNVEATSNENRPITQSTSAASVDPSLDKPAQVH